MKALGHTALALAAAAIFSGCASPPGPYQSGGAILGGASGAAVGGIIGNNSGSGHTGKGALIGGVVGALAGALVGSDIDEATRARVVQGQPLSLEDVKALHQAGVSDELIISQIRATGTRYQLGTAQILDLKQAGLSDRVIDQMISTQVVQTRGAPPPVEYYAVPVYPQWRYHYYHVYPPPATFHLHWDLGHRHHPRRHYRRR